MTTGVLLLNLGTPSAPTTKAVRRYLREFLNDPAVIDLPWLARTILVNGIIIPRRAKQSAHAYASIWTKEGSPLLVHSQQLATALQTSLGNTYRVALGMRYGAPSITSAVAALRDVERVIVLPLFPQYSNAATGSAVKAARHALASYFPREKIQLIREHYSHPLFIHALAERVNASLAHTTIDALLLSYHGLPERHLRHFACFTDCDRTHPCGAITEKNKDCYRAQCYATSRLLAKEINIPSENIITTFQSRLGKTPWIRPYTDEQLPLLYAQGVRHLAVMCPSFATDCLETLEEIGIRLRDAWLAFSETRFTLIPCLNHDAPWVHALHALVLQH